MAKGCVHYVGARSDTKTICYNFLDISFRNFFSILKSSQTLSSSGYWHHRPTSGATAAMRALVVPPPQVRVVYHAALLLPRRHHACAGLWASRCAALPVTCVLGCQPWEREEGVERAAGESDDREEKGERTNNDSCTKVLRGCDFFFLNVVWRSGGFALR